MSTSPLTETVRSQEPVEVLVTTGIPLYAANLEHTIRLFDPETGNYSGLAVPVAFVEEMMRTGRPVFMRIY